MEERTRGASWMLLTMARQVVMVRPQTVTKPPIALQMLRGSMTTAMCLARKSRCLLKPEPAKQRCLQHRMEGTFGLAASGCMGGVPRRPPGEINSETGEE